MASYDNIGGVSVIADAVEEFYGRLRADPILAGYFDDTDAARLETHQRMFITAVLGGPDAYEGRDMRAAHAHLPITDRDFDLFLEHLGATLSDLGTADDRISEVMDALSPLRVEIVSAARAGPDEWGSQDPTGGGD